MHRCQPRGRVCGGQARGHLPVHTRRAGSLLRVRWYPIPPPPTPSTLGRPSFCFLTHPPKPKKVTSVEIQCPIPSDPICSVLIHMLTSKGGYFCSSDQPLRAFNVECTPLPSLAWQSCSIYGNRQIMTITDDGNSSCNKSLAL